MKRFRYCDECGDKFELPDEEPDNPMFLLCDKCAIEQGLDVNAVEQKECENEPRTKL